MTVFKVSDMTCGHCEKSIRRELVKAGPEVQVSVDLKEKTVTVTNLPDEQVLALLKEVGYHPEKMK